MDRERLIAALSAAQNLDADKARIVASRIVVSATPQSTEVVDGWLQDGQMPSAPELPGLGTPVELLELLGKPSIVLTVISAATADRADMSVVGMCVNYMRDFRGRDPESFEQYCFDFFQALDIMGQHFQRALGG